MGLPSRFCPVKFFKCKYPWLLNRMVNVYQILHIYIHFNTIETHVCKTVIWLWQDFFVAKPSHRFALLYLDNEPAFVRSLFKNSYAETLNSATRTLLSIQIPRVSTFNVGCAYYCLLKCIWKKTPSATVCCWIYMSRDMRFPTMWYWRQEKAQTSLRIRADWSEPLLVA